MEEIYDGRQVIEMKIGEMAGVTKADDFFIKNFNHCWSFCP